MALGKSLGIAVTALDIDRHVTHNLQDEFVWNEVVMTIRAGTYDSMLAVLPSETFGIKTGSLGSA